MDELTMEQVRKLLQNASDTISVLSVGSHLEPSYVTECMTLVDDLDSTVRHIDDNFVVVYYP